MRRAASIAGPHCEDNKVGSAPKQPRQDRNRRADEQHAGQGEEEFESRPINDDVTWEMKQWQPAQPRPDEAGDDQYGAEDDEQSVHRFRLLRGKD